MEISDVEGMLGRFVVGVTDLLPVPVLAIWAHGSLAMGDYQPGRSDIDLVAVIAEPLSEEQARRLTDFHGRLLRDQPTAAKLHCSYVPMPQIAEVDAEHYTFAQASAQRRAVSPVSRCELLRAGRVLSGASPTEILPHVSDVDLAAYLRHMLRTYYLTAVTKWPTTWFQDAWIDQVVLACARAAVTLRDGRLITKSEALDELARCGAPDRLVADIRQRRYGEIGEPGLVWRLRRALMFRRYMSSEIRSLLADPPAVFSSSSRTWSGARRRETSGSPPGSGSPSCPGPGRTACRRPPGPGG